MHFSSSKRIFWHGISAWLPAILFIALWLPNLWGNEGESVAAQLQFWQNLCLGALIWLLCIAATKRLWLALWIALPAALIWPLELWVRLTQATPISAHTVALLGETNWAEGTNFLTAYGWQPVLLTLVWLLIYGHGVMWTHRFDTRWSHRSRYWVLAIALPMLTLNMMNTHIQETEITNTSESVLNDPGVPLWGGEWETVFPINIAIAVVHHHHQQKNVQKLQMALKQRQLGAQQLAGAKAPEIMVLVIGESASATRWGVLGYERNTTPRVHAIDGVAIFSNVVALSNATRTAIPNVLARQPVLWPDGRVDWEAEPSIVHAFKEVGYRTHWLSNQAPLGQHDTAISVYAKEADDVRFLNPATYQHRTSYDDVLLAPLRSILQQPGKHFIVLHLLGSHFDYALRYPSDFDHFQPSSQNASSPTPEQVNNSYDNSVRYTDHILSEVIAATAQHGRPSAVAYFSDHGVDPVIGPCASQSAGRRSEAAYRVPTFLWMSDRLRSQAPLQWQQLQDNAHQPYTTRAVYATLLELASIHLPDGLPTENLLYPAKAPSAGRLVAGNGGRYVNFDEIRTTNTCGIAGG